jgi:hypothetical protein
MTQTRLFSSAISWEERVFGETGPSDQGEHIRVVQYSLWNKTVIRVGVGIRGSVLCRETAFPETVSGLQSA